MKLKSYSILHRANATCMMCYTMLVVILVATYLLEVLKGSRTVSYFAVFSALAIIPYIISQIIYQRNKESIPLRHVIAAGYGIFYVFVLFTTVSPLAYVYALMLVVSMLCYNDCLLVLRSMILVTLANIIQVVVMGTQGQIASADMPNIEIRIFSLILFTFFLTLSTQVSAFTNKQQLSEVETEKQHTGHLMKQILTVADQMSNHINDVSAKMETLNSTAEQTKNAIEQVNQGTLDTVESVQMQLEKTTEIQNAIEKVGTASNAITDNISATREEISASQSNIDQLIHHVELSNEANENVSKELEELTSYTSQMQTIIELINSITTQTSLLSLNASIEAARAGEAGRGFAVVASEISNLATQTNDATVNITELIDSISQKLSEVVRVIKDMIQNASEQNVAANSTAENFRHITDKTETVYQEAGKLSRLVTGLTSANEQVVSGIETISAATEEVTAHSNVTLETSENNSAIASDTNEIVKKLSQLAEELKTLED